MNVAAIELFGVVVRWIHIASMALVVGGVTYARLVVAPALEALKPEDRAGMLGVLAARYRPLLFSGIAGLVVSGLYNLMSQRGHTSYYHAWFGIKMLLAAHVFATAVLLTSRPKPGQEARQVRRMTSTVVSGFIILMISAYLRRIF